MPKSKRHPSPPQGHAAKSLPEVILEGLPEINLNATAPVSVAKLKLGKRWFAVCSIMDVQAGRLQAVLAEKERLRQKAASWHEQIALARKQILMLIPDLTEADLDKLTAREIATLSGRLFAAFDAPPKER